MGIHPDGMLQLFVIGLVVGASMMTLWGALEGLFGRWLLVVILVVLSGLLVALVSAVGVETAASGLAPWPYWAGFVIGCIVGFVPSLVVEQTLRTRDGDPLLVAMVRQ